MLLITNNKLLCTFFTIVLIVFVKCVNKDIIQYNKYNAIKKLFCTEYLTKLSQNQVNGGHSHLQNRRGLGD